MLPGLCLRQLHWRRRHERFVSGRGRGCSASHSSAVTCTFRRTGYSLGKGAQKGFKSMAGSSGMRRNSNSKVAAPRRAAVLCAGCMRLFCSRRPPLCCSPRSLRRALTSMRPGRSSSTTPRCRTGAGDAARLCDCICSCRLSVFRASLRSKFLSLSTRTCRTTCGHTR